MKIVIVDNNTKDRRRLKRQIKSILKIDIQIIEANNVDNGIISIMKHHPKLVFLNIEMPNETGFDIIKKIDKRKINVVVISSYDYFTKKAFSMGVKGYLLKPINNNEIIKIVYNLFK